MLYIQHVSKEPFDVKNKNNKNSIDTGFGVILFFDNCYCWIVELYIVLILKSGPKRTI